MATNTNALSEKITYSVVINSKDKISGTNNNCSFYIPWITVLPERFDFFKIVYNYQSTGGNYKDNVNGITNTSAKLYCDFGARSLTYDTSSNGPSQNMGIITRDIQTATTSSNTFSAFFYQNTSKCISRPVNNLLNVQIFNNYNNLLLVDTNTATPAAPLLDMTSWILFLEFIPIENYSQQNSREH
jgi:hypothetical protein